MPSPFPGMDPFIECQAWQDFHAEFITGVRAALSPHLVPRYVVRIEERVYLEQSPEERPRSIVPDVTVIVEPDVEPAPSAGGTATLVAPPVTPVLVTLPMPERQREAFLTVRERESRAVVTIIELLSPGNKRTGSTGRSEYLAKRQEVLASAAHLIELDLLRGGERLPTVEPLPAGDYYAIVSRRRRRPTAEVYAWSLSQPLPPIPIPLAGEDPDATLDLQTVFNTVYDRAYYAYSLDYRAPVEPPVDEAELAWTQALLAVTPEHSTT